MLLFSFSSFVLFAACCTSISSGAATQLHTPDAYNYLYLDDKGIAVDVDNPAIIISLKAKNDAHVTLSMVKGSISADSYEIVIGGWNNAKSVIRKCSHCTNQATHEGAVLSEPNSAWPTDVNGFTTITVGKGDTPFQNTMMQWTDKSSHQVNFIGVCTAFGSTGEWLFKQDNPCDPNPCEHGTCIASGGDFKCNCDEDFSGDRCEIEEINPCKENPCKNNGDCVKSGNSFECECKKNFYVGKHCEEEVQCALAVDAGSGLKKGATKRFYFNSKIGKCRKFKYTLEGGNENNFPSKKPCKKACKKGLKRKQCVCP